MLRSALRAAMTGRRGPVLVEIPRDVLNDRARRMAALAPERVPRRPTRRRRIPTPSARPRGSSRGPSARCSSVGGGVTWARRTRDLAVQLAPARRDADHHRLRPERRGAERHPLYIGPLGRAGSPEAAEACRRADLMLVVGSRLGPVHHALRRRRYIRPGTAIVQVDVDSRDIGRVLPRRGRHPGRRARDAAPPCWTRSRRRRARRARAGAARGVAPGSGRRCGPAPGAALGRRRRLDARALKPQRVYAELRRALPPDTIVALDAGAAPAYGYDRLQFVLAGRGRFSPRSTSAGSASPSRRRSAPSSAGPGRPALAVHGDGGFLMNAQELETAVRHGINAVTPRDEQRLLGHRRRRTSGTSTAGATSAATVGQLRATTAFARALRRRGLLRRAPGGRSATPSTPRSAAASRRSSRSRSTPTKPHARDDGAPPGRLAVPRPVVVFLDAHDPGPRRHRGRVPADRGVPNGDVE